MWAEEAKLLLAADVENQAFEGEGYIEKNYTLIN